MAISLGCDPEFFLTNNNSIVSAIGLIGGTKEKPLQVDEGALQEDNVLAEINIIPALTKDQWITRINSVMEKLKQVTSLDLEVKPSHVFDKEYLKSVGPAAFAFGCDPDMNAYTGEVNPKPNPYTLLRTAGGHIHIGSTDIDVRLLVKTLDLYLAVPSVILDDDNQRRTVYGKAGAYRIKPYGVEYRTLSNFWLRSDSLKIWAFEQTQRAIRAHRTITLPREDVIVDCINTGDKDQAESLINSYNLQTEGI
jgi:hypothetical protein